MRELFEEPGRDCARNEDRMVQRIRHKRLEATTVSVEEYAPTNTPAKHLSSLLEDSTSR